MSAFEGANLAATWETADGNGDSRMYIGGTRPQIDTSSVTVEIAMREREADAGSYGPAEGMEDTGMVPAHASGNYANARIVTASGASWSSMKGIKTAAEPQGKR